MGLREDKKRETRRQIRDTSVALFGEHGVASTRVADIAALLRISEATFFNYFPSKQAICEEAVAEVITNAIDAAMTGQGRVDEKMQELASLLVAAFTADRPLIALLRRHPEMLLAASRRLDRPRLVLTNRIAAAQDDGIFRATPAAGVLGEVYLDIVLMVLARALNRDRTDKELESDLVLALAVWTDGCAQRKPARRLRTQRRVAGLPTTV